MDYKMTRTNHFNTIMLFIVYILFYVVFSFLNYEKDKDKHTVFI